MGLADAIIIPDVLPYLVALLALLLVWQFHQVQVMKGRIQAVDFWDRVGVRMYVHINPDDKETCSVCRDAIGRVFRPSVVAKKDFSPLHGFCTNPTGCRCLLVGMYGAWPEARQLVERLRVESKKRTIQLSEKELAELLNGSWERSVSATTDRISIHMLEASRAETSDPETAIIRYRFVIDQAKEARDLPFVVPSYFRLVDVLAQVGGPDDALEVIDRFEQRYESKKPIPYFPTETQRGLMSLKKSRLSRFMTRSSRRQPQGGSPDSARVSSRIA